MPIAHFTEASQELIFGELYGLPFLTLLQRFSERECIKAFKIDRKLCICLFALAEAPENVEPSLLDDKGAWKDPGFMHLRSYVPNV